MTAQYLYRLDEIQPHLQGEVGNKAFYLGQLAQANYPVVPGVVATSSMFLDFWQQIRWQAPLFADFPNSSLHIDVDNYRQLRAIAQQLQQAIHSTALPTDWSQQLAAAVHPLGGNVLIFRPSVALSNTLIPHLDTHIRGLLPTYTCTFTSEAIAQTLKQTWAGLFRAKSLFYWRRMGIPLQEILLSVLVQPVYPVQFSGRLVPETAQQLTVETIWGMGKALTTGEAVPERYFVHPASGTIHHREPGHQVTVYGVNTISHPSADPASPTPPAFLSQSLAEVLANGVFSDALTAEDGRASRVWTPETSPLTTASNLPWQPSPWQGLSALQLDGMMPDPPLSTAMHRAASSSNRSEESDSIAITLPTPLSDNILQMLLQMSQRVNHHLRQEVELEWVVCSHGVDPAAAPNASLKLYLTQVLPTPRQAPPAHPQPASQTSRRALAQTVPAAKAAADITTDISTAEATAPKRWTGLGAAPGQNTARAWVFSPDKAAAADRAVAPLPPGYILVAPDVMPDWLHLIRAAGGVVSERGGMTCHAAVVARELGIPAVVGVPAITQELRTGDWVIIDGDRSTVRLIADPADRPNHPHPISSEPTHAAYTADSGTAAAPDLSPAASSPATSSTVGDRPSLHSTPTPKRSPSHFATPNGDKTSSNSNDPTQRLLNQLTKSDRPNATQLMVSISQPEALLRLANQPIDGIGLLRAELALMPLFDQKPPQWWIDQGHHDILCQRITTHISQFAEAIYPLPVYYRSLDLRSRDFSSLFASPAHAEAHDLLGIHGTWSYQLDATLFDIELAALHNIQLAGFDNIRLILPFVRTVEEFSYCRQHVLDAGLYDSANFQLWIMAEVPSVMFLLPDYATAGAEGIAIGTNDLTQLLLAIDRDHPQMQPIFNQRHPAVQAALRHLIQLAQELQLPCSICGQAPVQHPDLIASLIEWGVTAICVAPAAVPSTYRAIARGERAMLLDALRRGDRPSG